ncbi:MAG: mechanosensitive ion channel family protein [Anaerolineales bacterium]|nr:mechanosensitive ion channel family protein [Anaerolineales bacterium]
MSLNNLDDLIRYYLTEFPWLDNLIRILFYYIVAVFVAFLLRGIARWLMKLGRLVPRGRKPSLERHNTLQSLVSSTINLVVFVLASLASLALFINPDTLAWVVGLFSAAFGFGARLLVSDYLGGLNFLFEDTFAVGEKSKSQALRQ